MGWLVVMSVCACLASVLGLLSVRYCFGRSVMMFFLGMSVTALVLVVGTLHHL